MASVFVKSTLVLFISQRRKSKIYFILNFRVPLLSENTPNCTKQNILSEQVIYEVAIDFK